MKKIMIIGSSWEQTPLLKKAQEMGFYVIATHPSAEADGFFYANEKYVVEPRDLKKLDEIFQKTKPDAVIADECDYSMFAVAYLCNKYHLPGPKMDSLIVTNNKYLQRKLANKGKIPQPKYKLCMTLSETEKAVDEIGFPIMVKPLDNRGSIGINKVEKREKLLSAFFEALANSHSRQLIIEEFIPGKVVTVEGLFTDTFFNLSFSTKKMHPKFPNNAMHLQYPGDLPNAVVKKLYSLNARLVKHVGITFGLTHSEFIVNDKGVYFIEIANRGGGVNTSNKIIPAVTGIDICELLIRAACGELVSVTNFTPYRWKKYAFLHFFDFGIGKVRSIKNVEKVSQLNGVLVVRLNIKVGEHLGFIKTAVNRPGFVILVGETVDQCKALLKEVYNTIHVEVEHELK